MRKVINDVSIIFGIIFWVFRAYVCLLASMQREFIFKPLNLTTEIIILFLTIPCIIAILRRNVLGAIAYFGMNVSYYGTMIYNKIVNEKMNLLSVFNDMEIMILFVGVLVSIILLFDHLIENGGINTEMPKSSWFYNDEKYNRNTDDRSDKNQYKIK